MLQKRNTKYINALHIDKLIITLLVGTASLFPTTGYTVQNNYIKSFDEVTLMHNKYLHNNGCLLTYDVLYNGEKVGFLRSSEKYHKPHVELELSKHLFYTKNQYYWYEVVSSIQEEFKLGFNNIRYIEIALDSTKDFVNQFRNIVFQSNWTQQCTNPRYEKSSSKTLISTVENQSYKAGTSGNMVSIYCKSSKSEQYIDDYFELNGFGSNPVYRLEAKLDNNYLRTLKNRGVTMDLQVLADTDKLAYILKEVANTKVSFKDLGSKYWVNGNDKYDLVSLFDDIELRQSEVKNYIPSISQSHFKFDDSATIIIKRKYYQYLESGNLNLLLNLYSYFKADHLDISKITTVFSELNEKFNGNRTDDVINRMNIAKLDIWGIKKQIVLARVNQSIFRIIKRLTLPVTIVGKIELVDYE